MNKMFFQLFLDFSARCCYNSYNNRKKCLTIQPTACTIGKISKYFLCHDCIVERRKQNMNKEAYDRMIMNTTQFDEEDVIVTSGEEQQSDNPPVFTPDEYEMPIGI